MGPLWAEGGEDGVLEDGEVGEDVGVVGVLVASCDYDCLDYVGGIIARVVLGDCCAEKRGRVGVDDDCGVRMLVVDCLPDSPRVIVEGARVLDHITEMKIWRVDILVCRADNRWPDEGSAGAVVVCLAIKVDDPDFELSQFALGAILHAPEDR